ncbi:hypothetical protein B296_00030948 [Ensete ventricosum]|uniref:Uncharacterized protein n=1 Tax=Ensete ventricosum TaxID=4639 RepID=A0A426XQ87_ENSVE|nr:hypothetical protein B296_00030948 [Ensete ventricosum]
MGRGYRLGSNERWRRLVGYQEGEQSSNNAAGAGGERTGQQQLCQHFGAIAAARGEEELAGGRCNIGDKRRGAAITLATTRATARAREDAATVEVAAGVGGKQLVQHRWPLLYTPRAATATNNSDVVGDRGERGTERLRGAAVAAAAMIATTTTWAALESQGSKGKDNSDRADE